LTVTMTDFQAKVLELQSSSSEADAYMTKPTEPAAYGDARCSLYWGRETRRPEARRPAIGQCDVVSVVEDVVDHLVGHVVDDLAVPLEFLHDEV
jgi:hypothetical protein